MALTWTDRSHIEGHTKQYAKALKTPFLANYRQEN